MDRPRTIDARGLLCPLPVLRLRKRLKDMSTGDIAELWADDPAAVIDVAHFCQDSGHELIESFAQDNTRIYRVRKAG